MERPDVLLILKCQAQKPNFLIIATIKVTTENMRSFAENRLFVTIKGRSKVNPKYDFTDFRETGIFNVNFTESDVALRLQDRHFRTIYVYSVS